MSEEENTNIVPVSTDIRIGNSVHSLDSLCSDPEEALPRWEQFARRFPEDRRISLVLRTTRLNVHLNLTIADHLGHFSEGNWDVFCPDGGSRTMAYYIDKRIEEGNVAPLIVVLGVSENISDEAFAEFKADVNYMKMIAN